MIDSRFSARLASLLIAALPIFSVHAAEPAAMLTDLAGGEVRSGAQRLAILSELGVSASLELGSGARATLVHFGSARQFDLLGPGAFRVTGAGVEIVAGSGQVTARAPLAAAYDKVRLRPSRVIQASISMRGKGDLQPLKLVAPAGSWIVDARPVFRWQKPAGASGYRFQLTDNTGGVLHQAEVGQETARLPDSVELKVGQTYAWQVNATLPDGREAEGWAEFGIIDAERRVRILAAQPGSGASFGDRVLFALLLEDFGLRDAAHELWAELVRERPSDPRLQTLGGAR